MYKVDILSFTEVNVKTQFVNDVQVEVNRRH